MDIATYRLNRPRGQFSESLSVKLENVKLFHCFIVSTLKITGKKTVPLYLGRARWRCHCHSPVVESSVGGLRQLPGPLLLLPAPQPPLSKLAGLPGAPAPALPRALPLLPADAAPAPGLGPACPPGVATGGRGYFQQSVFRN